MDISALMISKGSIQRGLFACGDIYLFYYSEVLLDKNVFYVVLKDYGNGGLNLNLMWNENFIEMIKIKIGALDDDQVYVGSWSNNGSEILTYIEQKPVYDEIDGEDVQVSVEFIDHEVGTVDNASKELAVDMLRSKVVSVILHM